MGRRGRGRRATGGLGLLLTATTLLPAAPLAAAAPAACTPRAALAGWSTARLAAQTAVVPVDVGSLAGVRPAVAAGAGGLILFGSRAPAGLAASLARLEAAAPGGIPPFVMVDEEGGAVERLENVVGPLPSARTMAATMSAPAIERLGRTVGARLRSVGVTMDLAPVLDIDGGPGPSATHPDGTRSFSPSAAVATADGLAFARGLRAGGVVPVVKHFPGLGGSTGNTDSGAASTLPWTRLEAGGLRPFAAAVAARLPAVMVATASVPGLSSVPAAVSHAVVAGELRGRLGFTGLVVTDSLSTTALTSRGFPLGRAVVAALASGADLVLYNADDPVATTSSVVRSITGAVATGALPRARLVEAVGHVLAAKGRLCPGG